VQPSGSDLPAPRPTFKRSLRVEVVDAEGVYLLGEQQNHLLRGRAYVAVAPLLDGRSTEEEICVALEDRVSAAEALYAIGTLRRMGFVVDRPAGETVSGDEAAFWEALGADAQGAHESLASASVSLVGIGDVDLAPLRDAFAEVGLREGAGGLRVAVADDYLHPDLLAFNRARIDANEPWLLARPSGLPAWIRPLFLPRRTGCWRCLAHRLAGHRRVERYLEGRAAEGTRIHPPGRAATAWSRRAIASLVTGAVARWIATGALPELEGRIVTFHSATFESQAHVLVRRPQCADCGDPTMVARAQAAALVLEPSAPALSLDAGRRQSLPEETLARLAHHVSPVTGILSKVTRMTLPGDDPRILYSYATDHNQVRPAFDLASLRGSLRAYCGGKGRTEAQARVSAVCESIERYCGVYQGDEARRRAALADLGDDAVDPRAILGFSARQYAERARWNWRHELLCWVPEPFDPERPTDWTPAWSLTHERTRYVATALSYYDYPFDSAPVFAHADSNGAAAGTTRAEAVLQGFLELVERDAVALWWYNRLRVPGVDMAAFGEPYLVEVATHWAARGRELWALDLTSDFSIPTFAVLSRAVGGRENARGGVPAESIVVGFGAHFDARVALLRATTEHNQFTPFLAALPVEGTLGGGVVVDWLRQATVGTERYLLPAEGVAPRTLDSFAPHATRDLREDVALCAEAVRRKGMEMLVVDQSRPDAGLAVVKVIVPGMRHFWARFGPGRLYDVPVAMGRLAAPTREDEMNPYPMFV
jgi:ribosomal protein S12 methylthiotransferase accessory factor